ncbi:MAG: MgtC/SapB family protein [Holophagaceae bacterium]|nr:MgtC/SapB family protein [Holophagaceae bacterium]
MLQLIPPEGPKIILVLLLSFLVGLDREERSVEGHRVFGGVRTFPIIGLLGYALALLSNGQILPLVLGFAVVGGFGMVSYWHKRSETDEAGTTTEMSALAIYLVGALVFKGHFWIATTLVVIHLFLLELKSGLEGMAKRLAPMEVIAFTKFMLLTAVILPVVPDREFTSFQINPFKTWLVVVAVSAVSYGSYVLQKMLEGRGGIFLSALLGGAYSSTVTTVVLAKQGAGGHRPHAISGGILAASGMMYLRLAVLVGLFNRELFLRLGPAFGLLGLAAIFCAWIWSRQEDEAGGQSSQIEPARNPLELKAAFLFAAIFLGMLLVTHLAVTHLGTGGVYSLAAVMGLSDVDPFIMGMTQTAAGSTPVHVASTAILIAVSSNNLIKGVYARSFSDPRAGRWSLVLLIILAILGLIPAWWV